MEKEEIRCVVRGRVQMVMYRDFVRRGAQRYGVVGSVRNLPDGTVEVLAQGAHKDLEKLLARMRRGSLLSHVEDVAVTWSNPTSSFDSFDIVV